MKVREYKIKLETKLVCRTSLAFAEGSAQLENWSTRVLKAVVLSSSASGTVISIPRLFWEIYFLYGLMLSITANFPYSVVKLKNGKENTE